VMIRRWAPTNYARSCAGFRSMTGTTRPSHTEGEFLITQAIINEAGPNNSI
jgi:hypothetical protein